MKKFLSILLAVLVIGACATTDASAKKRVTKGKKATKTAVTTVAKGAFAGGWDDARTNIRPIQLRLWYDEANDSYSGEVAMQTTISDLSGKVKGNTLYLTGDDGVKITCTMKGDILYARMTNVLYKKTITVKMEEY